jgi:hypothetical protein
LTRFRMTYPDFNSRREFCLNELSIKGSIPQHDFVIAVKQALGCLDALRRLVQGGSVRVYLPTALLGAPVGVTTFQGAIGRHCDTQTKTRWEIFRTQMLRIRSPSRIQLHVKSQIGELDDFGEASEIQCRSDISWLSFIGHPLYSENRLAVDPEGLPEIQVQNFSIAQLLIDFVPVYEPNPKHRKAAYWAGGELVSAMDLEGDVATHALLQSVGDEDSRYIFYLGNFYKFRRHSDRPAFHGHICDVGEIPQALRPLVPTLNI